MPWTPISAMRRGARPDFTLLREPGNAYTTRAQQWFLDQLLALEPGSEDVDGGGYAHKPGYHDTVAHNDARSGTGKDYSARDPEDRSGPRDKTRARDWTFRDAQRGDYADFARYGDRLLAAYRANDPRLSGWREYLGRVSKLVTIGGKSTRRVGIDFRKRYLRIPDSSHDWHGHFSEDTVQVESFANKWKMLTALAGWSVDDWKQSIGLAQAPTVEDIELSAEAVQQIKELHAALLAPGTATYPATVVQQIKDVAWVLVKGPAGSGAWVGGTLSRIAEAAGISPAELEQVAAAAREGAAAGVDQVVAAVLAKLPAAGDGGMTRDQVVAAVEEGVRDAFAGGLAPAPDQTAG